MFQHGDPGAKSIQSRGLGRCFGAIAPTRLVGAVGMRRELEGGEATVHDVQIFYKIFLGRAAETETVVRDLVGADLQDLSAAFIASDEFRQNVFSPLAFGGRWSSHLFTEPVDRSVTAVASKLGIEATVEDRPCAAASWASLLHTLFANGSPLGRYIPTDLIHYVPAFVRHLERLGMPRPVGRFDGLDGLIATGWILHEAGTPAPVVEFVVDGEVIHSVTPMRQGFDPRLDSASGDLLGFRTRVPLALGPMEAATIHARLRGSEAELEGSPRETRLPREISRRMLRRERASRPLLDRLRRRLDREAGGRVLSILLPLADARPDRLDAAIASVRMQWCSGWELLFVGEASSTAEILAVIDRHRARDDRIRPSRHDGLDAAMIAAGGECAALLRPDDVLEPDAVQHMLRAALTGADLIYADEIVFDDEPDIVRETLARPAFSWDFYLSHRYFQGFVCIRTAAARAVGGWGTAADADETDLVLRLIERARSVAHVPAVLSRRRHRPISPAAEQARLAALRRHLERTHRGASVRQIGAGVTRVEFPDDGEPILIVIPTKNRVDLLRRCVHSIRATTLGGQANICIIDHQSDDIPTRAYLEELRASCTVHPFEGPFNFAAMNNEAVAAWRRRHGFLPKYIMFMNNDVEAMHEGWLERMRSLAARSDVGIVGTNLLYSNHMIQHAGVVMGVNGCCDHAHRQESYFAADARPAPGYLATLVSTRDFSAVTAACMMLRSRLFEELGGFDEQFRIGFNDVDLCLRARALGLKVLNDGGSVLFHHESTTRKVMRQIAHLEDDRLFLSRWGHLAGGQDPFYSPLFASHGLDHQIARHAARPAHARLQPGLGIDTRRMAANRDIPSIDPRGPAAGSFSERIAESPRVGVLTGMILRARRCYGAMAGG